MEEDTELPTGVPPTGAAAAAAAARDHANAACHDRQMPGGMQLWRQLTRLLA